MKALCHLTGLGGSLNRVVGNIIFRFHRLSTVFSSVSTSNVNNVSETLERLIRGYDIRLRPKFGGE